MYAGKLRVPIWAMALTVAAAGCAAPAGRQVRVRLPGAAPAAMYILAAQPAAVASAVERLVARSARPGERLVVAGPAGPGWRVLFAAAAPWPPTISGPVPPKQPGTGATSFTWAAYRRHLAEFQATLARDRRLLENAFNARLMSWAAAVGGVLARTSAASAATGANLRSGLGAAASFFGSLEQAGVNIATRRVVLVLGSGTSGGTAMPLPPRSLSGVTVIMAGFDRGQAAGAEWQADFLQAGAARAVVLVPAAADELGRLLDRALDGQDGPAPVQVRFALNKASLDSRARATLTGLAAVLAARHQDAAVTVLGFADPLGSRARNSVLSLQRALAVRAFLISHGVADSRVFAAGYGAGLPAARSGAGGAQPLDRRVVIVIQPVS
jgi:outer membrane protein OmpA-like peptidoglycan-associated protein